MQSWVRASCAKTEVLKCDPNAYSRFAIWVLKKYLFLSRITPETSNFVYTAESFISEKLLTFLNGNLTSDETTDCFSSALGMFDFSIMQRFFPQSPVVSSNVNMTERNESSIAKNNRENQIRKNFSSASARILVEKSFVSLKRVLMLGSWKALPNFHLDRSK